MKQQAANCWAEIQAVIEQATPHYDGLLGGNLGLVWYYYYIWKMEGSPEYAQKAQELIEQVFKNMNTDPKLMGASFSTGIAGFCYVVTELSQQGFIEIAIDNELADLDEYLYNSALRWVEEGFIDYLHGTFGVIVYFSKRLKNPIIYGYADDLVKKIISRAIVDEKGWRLSGFLIKPEDSNEINFSLSHGLTSFLIILLNIYQKGLVIDGIESIIGGGAKFIISHQLDVDLFNDKFSAFPFSVRISNGETSVSNRLAWCYGDLNIILFLYRAAEFLQEAFFKKIADNIGAFSLMRKTEVATLATDTHFCHGSAGIAQFYYRLYKTTGIEAYNKGFKFWIDKTLGMVNYDLSNLTFKDKEGGLLEGWPGVALVLKTYISDEPTDWDKIFLL